jgi:drug/metabolite transporter superfamily protein YnfA
VSRRCCNDLQLATTVSSIFWNFPFCSQRSLSLSSIFWNFPFCFQREEETMSDIFPSILAYLTGSSAYHVELRTFAHVLQGAMVVRNGPNRDRKMHWFHAFALTTIIGFGGGWFTFLWMGKPTSMITSGDVNVTLACIAFVIVNYTPNDIGYKIANSLPAVFVITSLAQMFRSMGTIGFISAAAKEVDPSPYYPIPVVGPILYGALLGNMGGFFRKGFDEYLQNGIPWPFQNGMSDLPINSLCIVCFRLVIFTHSPFLKIRVCRWHLFSLVC